MKDKSLKEWRNHTADQMLAHFKGLDEKQTKQLKKQIRKNIGNILTGYGRFFRKKERAAALEQLRK